MTEEHEPYRVGRDEREKMRFRIEYDPVCYGIILRLPCELGISFWPPRWWRCVFGVEASDIGIVWSLGMFRGEVWREEQDRQMETLE